MSRVLISVDFPPSGALSQDVVLTYHQNCHSLSYPKLTEEQLVESVQAIWKSLEPLMIFNYEKSSLFYQLETLACDYGGFNWIKQRPHLFPKELRLWAGEFVRSLLYQLEIGEIPISETIEIELLGFEDKSMKTTQSPIYVIHSIATAKERLCDNDNDWMARVCSYLSWVVEYLHAPHLSWALIIQAAADKRCLPVVRQTLHATIEYLLHFRILGSKGAFVSLPLAKKLSSPDFMSKFSFNERFACLLLEYSYFRFLLEDERYLLIVQACTC